MLEVITPSDRASSIWQKLQIHYEEKLQGLYIHLSKPKSEQETNILRGQIQEISTLLALGDDRPMVRSEFENT